MAANMQQMAGPGGMMPQQRPQLSQIQMNEYLHNALKRHQEQGNFLGWQSQADIKERLIKTHNLVSNIALAGGPSFEWSRAAEMGLAMERDIFTKAADKQQYDQAMIARSTQFLRRRQENVSALQNSVQAQAAAAQAQQHQQQFMMNQAMQQNRMGQNMGQNPQQNLQHLQFQMQNSPMQQQMMNMGAAGAPLNGNIGPNQQMFQMENGQPRPVNRPDGNQGMADQARILEMAHRMASQHNPAQKDTIRNSVRQKFPERAAEYEANAKDPVMIYFQHQAMNQLKQNNLLRAQGGGMPQNGNGQAVGPHQMMQAGRGQMNPNMLTPGALQQQAAVAAGTEFGGQFNVNMESIMNQQKAGFLAQEQGQTVVPASTAGGAPNNRNATPQPNGAVQGQQGMQNQPGANQTPRPPQNQPQFNMQQAQQQAQQQQQAQLRAQQQLQQLRQQQQGMPPTQSPGGMGTLNTPMRRPPSAMNTADGQAGAQGNGHFASQLDPRFNQGNQRPMNPGLAMNTAMLNSMMAQMTPEQRQHLTAAGPEKMQEFLANWQEGRRQMQLKAMQAGNNMPQGPGPNLPQQQQQKQQQQQPGQFKTPNPANQMQMSNGMMQPQAPNPMNTSNSQNQMIISQQTAMLQRLRQQPQQSLAPQQQQMMDAQEVPVTILSQIQKNFPIPQEIRIWKHFRAWAENNLPPQAKEQIRVAQNRQFISMMSKNLERRNMQAAQQQQQNPMGQQASMGQQPQQQPGQQPPQMQRQPPQPTPGGMPQNAPPNQMPQQNQRAGMLPNMSNVPQHLLQVTQQEIQNARANHPRAANMPDEQLKAYLVSQKQRQLNAHLHQQQQILRQQGGQANQQQMAASMPPHGAPVAAPQPQQQPTPVPAPAPAAPTPQPAPAQPAPANKQTAAEAKAANARNAANNRAAAAANKAPSQSPATTRKNLKRPSPDDAADTAASNTQPSQASQPQQAPQEARPQVPRRLPNFTPEQLAQMAPEQRAKYEQFKRAQAQMNNEGYEKLKVIGQEEMQRFREEGMTEVIMSPEERAMTLAKLPKYVLDMGNIGRALGRWYQAVPDDTRARLFFRHRLRLTYQFSDGDTMKQLKDNLSIRIPEIEEGSKLLHSMIRDCAGISKNQQAAPAAAKPQEASGAQPTPLSAANLEKQTQALSKAQHNRSASKSGQAPAAPTTAQPPFPFGAASPHGQPSYIGKPTVNRENLQLPPRKKAKVGEQPTPPQATPSPQISKTASPEVMRAPEAKPQPPKPTFKCTESDCDSISGFSTEAALKAHVQEEHIKPRQDPIKFMQENLALALGLDANGHPKDAEGGVKSAQTPASNAAGTPMSRAASTAKGGAKSAGNAGPEKQGMESNGAVDPWANTIDPQSLFSTIGPFEFGAGGAIANMKAYRSLTPNDTPESSKDSGASEPNSDIPENSGLDIDIKWQAFDADLLMDMNNVSMDGLESAFLVDNSMPSMVTERPNWDDVHIDFDKPFVMDTSLFRMNVS